MERFTINSNSHYCQFDQWHLQQGQLHLQYNQIQSQNYPLFIIYIHLHSHFMQLLAYRSLYNAISSNVYFTKTISALSKISQTVYQDKSYREKKPKCWICDLSFDHPFTLIMHLELIHQDCVLKYEVKNQCLSIVINPRYQAEKNDDKIAQGFMVGLVKNNFNANHNFSGSSQISKSYNLTNNGCSFLGGRLQSRAKTIVNNIIAKISRPATSKQRIYFHSTNIFKRIDPDEIDEDSEEDVGEVERQLEKLRIEDFSDVNDNDKKFFIEWNRFIHDNKKRISIIYAYDMPNLFVQFSGLAQEKGIPRINLVMHAWTLWSVGQISSNDVVNGLNRYDTYANRKATINQAEGSETFANNNGSKINNELSNKQALS